MARKAWFNSTTPRGVAKYPHTSTPDTKFVPEGEYHIKLLLKQGCAEEQALTKTLDEQAARAFEQMKEENKKFAKVMKLATPYKPELDKDGNETGNTEFGFKMKAVVTIKNGKRAGESFTQQPRHFDAKGKPLVGKVELGGGSIVKVNYDLSPYFNAKDKVAGVSCRLQAIQIIDLKKWSKRDASDFGFGAEDGYDSEESGDSFPGAETEETTGSETERAPLDASDADASDF